MFHAFIMRSVDVCIRYAWGVLLVAVLIAGGAGTYAARNFAIDTNVNNLLSVNLSWRQRELAYQAAFPQLAEVILVVVEAPTPELASAAARSLTQDLSGKPDLFRSVQEVGGGPFFQHNGLLFLPADEVARTTGQLVNASPMISTLAADQSLRGLIDALSMVLAGVRAGRPSLDNLARPLNTVADTLEAVAKGQPASFSWKVLLEGETHPSDLRRIIVVWPVLNHAELQPGFQATSALRKIADGLQLRDRFRANVRITGSVPIEDAEFATLQQGLLLNSILTGSIILAILWLALRSIRLVLVVAITLALGLVTTAGLGIALVRALNPISIAFAVLFVGLGADFAIQYTMRYRTMRHRLGELPRALVAAAGRVSAPLTLAAIAAAAGFLSFVPTAYTGLAQLGIIAGAGMIVAYMAALTLLPALIRLVNPPEELTPLGQPRLAPIDAFLSRHRIMVVVVTIAIAAAGLPALAKLKFDFNPLDLRDKKTEAVATVRELNSDPGLTANTAEVIAPSESAAVDVARQLAALPEVAEVRTLERFIPADQDRKLALILNANRALSPVLNAASKPPPSDNEDVAALRDGARNLEALAGGTSGPGADASRRLADGLTRLASADAAQRVATTMAFIPPLAIDLDDLREMLGAQPVTRASLPEQLVRDWVSPQGAARVEAVPKGNSNDEAILHAFARAVLRVQPTATGTAIETFEWGDAMIKAFARAAGWALLSIAILLFIVLRHLGDVLRTLGPLVLAGVVTLEICGLTNFPLNYANIIALPVLLGVGVAFKIYYVMAWRDGQTEFLQSALTRAVFFSALLTATAFGSLWFSSHSGTSSMGKLLALSLACTLTSAVLFQPALMGPPRGKPAEQDTTKDQAMPVGAT